MHSRLTDRSVAQLRVPETGRVDVWDSTLKAFGVRVSSSGSKTWMVAMRRPGARNPSRITLGKFPQMRTEAARAEAAALLNGETETPAPRGALFEKAVDRFLAHGRARNGRPWRSNTQRAFEFVLTEVAKRLHSRQLTTIRRKDIADVLHRADVERGEATAALTRSALARFFAWAVEEDELQVNPAKGVPIYATATGDRVLSDAEIRSIWHADSDPAFRSVLRLCLLVGCRRSEAGNLKWSELDLDTGTWLLPGERCKTHTGRLIPLAPAAVAEIMAQPRVLGRDAVFGKDGFTSWSEHKKKLDRQLGFAVRWRVHDLRRTTRTRLHGLGISHDVITRVLGHGIDPLAKRYNWHDYSKEMRAALDLWAAQLEKITGQTCGEVVAM
jgi:integrase